MDSAWIVAVVFLAYMLAASVVVTRMGDRIATDTNMEYLRQRGSERG